MLWMKVNDYLDALSQKIKKNTRTLGKLESQPFAELANIMYGDPDDPEKDS